MKKLINALLKLFYVAAAEPKVAVAQRQPQRQKTKEIEATVTDRSAEVLTNDGALLNATNIGEVFYCNAWGVGHLRHHNEQYPYSFENGFIRIGNSLVQASAVARITLTDSKRTVKVTVPESFCQNQPNNQQQST